MEWKTHIELIIPKMSSSFYAVTSLYSSSDMTTLKIIYFANLHSVTEYGIIFCGKSSDSWEVFQLQKKIIRIMTESKPTDQVNLYSKH